MYTYDYLEELIEDLDDKIEVENIDETQISIYYNSNYSEDVISEIMDELEDSRFLSKSDRLIYVDRVEYEEDNKRLRISFCCTLVDNEDERTEDELYEAAKDAAEERAFEAQREEQFGL